MVSWHARSQPADLARNMGYLIEVDAACASLKHSAFAAQMTARMKH
jgi:hypothetical protein